MISAAHQIYQFRNPLFPMGIQYYFRISLPEQMLAMQLTQFTRDYEAVNDYRDPENAPMKTCGEVD